jgi:hypothetical protein
VLISSRVNNIDMLSMRTTLFKDSNVRWFLSGLSGTRGASSSDMVPVNFEQATKCKKWMWSAEVKSLSVLRGVFRSNTPRRYAIFLRIGLIHITVPYLVTLRTRLIERMGAPGLQAGNVTR